MVRSSRRKSRGHGQAPDSASGPGGSSEPARDRRPPSETTLAGYRLLRRIASGERADVFLAAVDGPAEDPAPLVVVRVYDAAASGAAIALEIEAMSTDASGSLPALFDIATLDDGRCALAVERIAGAPISRVIAERRLAPGEAVTVLAPIAVAVGELARHGFVHTRLSPGDVLLDGRGRPRLIGLGGLERLSVSPQERTPLLRAGHVALAELVAEVVAATERPEVFADVLDLVESRLTMRPFAPCEAELERALFAAADPAPVRGIAAAAPRGLPSRVTVPLELGTRADRRDGAYVGDDGGASDPPVRSAIRAVLDLAQWPAFLADGRRSGDVAEAPEARGAPPDVRKGVQAMLRRRRPALVVASLIGGGALVLLLTLVPPKSVDAAPSETGARTAAPVAETSDRDPATNPPSLDAVSGDDPVAAVQALLVQRAECFDRLDLACLESILQPGSAAEAAEVAAMGIARDGGDAPPAFDASGAAVTAEMGSAVLVTVPYASGEREPASLLVMRGEAGWRLREIFD